MANHYFVDPSIQGTSPLPRDNPALLGGPYETGATVMLPSGVRINGVQHLPEFNLYESYEGTPPPQPSDEYYSYRVDLFYESSANPALIRVREQGVYTTLTNEQIHDERMRELNAIAQRVANQGHTVNGLSAGNIAVQTVETFLHQYAQLQLSEATIPGTTAVKMTDQFDGWFALQKADCEKVHTQVAIFHTSVRNANYEQKQIDLDIFLTAQDRANLVSYDLETGWPDAPVAPTSKTSQAQSQPSTRPWIPVSTVTEMLESGRFMYRDNGEEVADVGRLVIFLRQHIDRIDEPHVLEQLWREWPWSHRDA